MEETRLEVTRASHPELGNQFEEALEVDISKHVAGKLDVSAQLEMNVQWAVVSRTTGMIALASKNFECYTVLEEDSPIPPGDQFQVLAKAGDWIEFDYGNDNSDEFQINKHYQATWLGGDPEIPHQHAND